MSLFKPHNLQTKFLLGLAAIMAAAAVVIVAMLRLHLNEMLEQDVRSKARLILSNVDALEGFMDQALEPAMCEVLAGERFMRESMSMSRTVMVPGEPEQEQFSYRRAGFGALATEGDQSGFGKQLLERFSKHSTAQLEEFFTRQGGEDVFVAARPLRARAGCLRCHGDSEQVPAELRERFGQWPGFNWTEGQLVGAQVVTLPLKGSLSRIHGATLGFVVMFSLGGVGFFALISVLFNRLVVFNLNRVLGVMRRYFPEEADSKAPAPANADQIEQLLASVEDFAGHLRQARSQLKSHAENLEQRVAARTAELSREAGARREDVALFVGLLNGMNRNHTRAGLIRASLELVAQRFGAKRAAFCCALTGQAQQAWPQNDASLVLPSNWQDVAGRGEALLEGQCALIPVQTTEVSRGLLYVCWAPGRQPDAQSVEVLKAVGQQLGIVMENLEALDGLVRHNDLFQSIFDGITDPLMLLDSSSRVMMANRAARRLPLTGQDPDEPGCGFLREALGIEPGKALPAHLMQDPSSREVLMPADRSFVVSLYPPREYLGPGGGLVVHVREITDQKRMLESSLQNEKLLAVGSLASGLAHEINNPLGVILCYAELLKPSLAGTKGADDLNTIVKHALQAQKVLGDLLGFVRPHTLILEPWDMTETVRQTVDIYSVRADAQGASLSLEGADAGPVTVLACASALEQVLANLLINALDAVPAQGGRVEVACGVEGERAFITVKDNGPGISSANLKRIFEPFFTTKEVGRGTGLGLAVVYGLVKDMGGHVEASSPGGAEFTVWLSLDGAET